MILPLLSALLGLLLSAHFSTVRTILGLLARPGYQPPDGWQSLERRTRRRLDDPAFPITVSLGRSLGTLMFVLGLWNAIFPSTQPPLWAAVLVGLASLLLLYLLGDFFPRLLARLRAERLLPAALGLQEVLSPLFLPFAAPVVRLRQFLELWLGWDGRFEFLNEEERAKVAEARAQDPQDAATVERQIIRAALDLGETRVREILTPRLQVAALSADAPPETIVEVLQRSKYSRLPVYEHDLDHMVGILHVKDLVGILPEQWDLRQLVRPVVHVPEAQLVSDLLKVLRSKQSHLAVVVDEHGAMSGVATMEDALEEIVGEIRDETDEEEPLLKPVGGGEFLVDGHARIDQVQHALGRDLPALPGLPDGVEADTVAGLFLVLSGHLPEVGESLEFGKWEMTVLELDGNRISRLRLLRLPDSVVGPTSEAETAVLPGDPPSRSA